MDSVTEAISHFIGLFHLTETEARLQFNYDSFAFLRNAEELEDLTGEGGLNSSEPIKLLPFAPDVNMPLAPRGVEMVSYVPETPFYPPPPPIYTPLIPLDPLQPMEFGGSAGPELSLRLAFEGAPTGPFQFEYGPPPGTIIISIQTNDIIDNDVLDMTDSNFTFVGFGDVTATLTTLMAVAETLQGPADGFELSGGTFLAGAEVLKEQLEEYSPTGIEQAVETENLKGVIENGETVSAVVELDDLMPSHKAEAKEAAARAKEADSPFYDEYTPHITSGGNTLMNSALLSSLSVDAAVIAVMGNAYSFNTISQVNVLSEQDSVGAGISAASVDPTRLVNSASYDEQSAPAQLFLHENGLRAYSIDTVEGDVVLARIVQQINFVSDYDQVLASFLESDLQITIGGNTAFNAVKALDIGKYYDFIVVDGNMIDINSITQTNVLMDNDMFRVTGEFEGTHTGNDNALVNMASISKTGTDTFKSMDDYMKTTAAHASSDESAFVRFLSGEDSLAGVGALRVLHIKGDLVGYNSIKQTNILGDNDEVHAAMDEFESENPAAVKVLTGGNALINIAAINDVGIDSEVNVAGELYSDALLVQAEFIDTGDALPGTDGAGLSNLASEAVAFLADSTAPSDAADSGVGGIVPTSDHLAASDGLYSALT
ncbi:MAG: hypothetical protein CSA72_12475 [Rhodobacterales bacterium]|nr:MAG: hypothetical protein CSA72_12475 [Rhodobacterales bacterium]